VCAPNQRSLLPLYLEQVTRGLSVKAGLDDSHRKAPLGVMITRKDHPITGDPERWFKKMAEEKPPV
jgi:hypothetical protein